MIRSWQSNSITMEMAAFRTSISRIMPFLKHRAYQLTLQLQNWVTIPLQNGADVAQRTSGTLCPRASTQELRVISRISDLYFMCVILRWSSPSRPTTATGFRRSWGISERSRHHWRGIGLGPCCIPPVRLFCIPVHVQSFSFCSIVEPLTWVVCRGEWPYPWFHGQIDAPVGIFLAPWGLLGTVFSGVYGYAKQKGLFRVIATRSPRELI